MSEDEYKVITLNNVAELTKVSSDDYENVKQYTWTKFNGYAFTKIDGKHTYLHNFIMGKAGKGKVIDHINRDKLDNRRENLRVATNSQNVQNREKQQGCTSEYIGVYKHPNSDKWYSCSSGVHLGAFENEIDAATKYDTYTLLRHGPHAQTNGLVTYEAVKDIDINTLLCNRPERDLPPNIWRKRNSFTVCIKYNKNVFMKVMPTLEEAVAKLDEFKQQIEDIKAREEKEHMAREITRNENGVAIIPVVNHKKEVVAYTTVSDAIWHECMRYSWNMGTNGYVQGYVDNYGKLLRLNRFVMGAADDELVDHIDHNKLNNTDENLRFSNHGNNNHNRKKKQGGTSKYFGVWKNGSMWTGEIRKDGERHYVGSYKTEEEAARAYNEKAKELYGEFAKLNTIE